MISTETKLDIEGHRGARGLVPENSIPAFLKAIELGVSTIEMDVCISKDNLVVVSHEPYMNHLFCSKPDGAPVTEADEKTLNLYTMEYAQITQFDTGCRGNQKFPEQEKMATYKPLLKEVIMICELYIKSKHLNPVRYNIEIKSEEQEYGISQPSSVAEFCRLVYEVIVEQLAPERVVLQSFDFAVLKHLKQQMNQGVFKKMDLSMLVEMEALLPSLDKLGFVPDIYSPSFKQLNAEVIEQCHAKGMKVIPWTVNQVPDMKQLIEWGVDGLITDYPNRALSL